MKRLEGICLVGMLTCSAILAIATLGLACLVLWHIVGGQLHAPPKWSLDGALYCSFALVGFFVAFILNGLVRSVREEDPCS